jgi:hypothetical protein
MLFNRPAIQFRQFGGRPKRAIARHDPMARERRLIGSAAPPISSSTPRSRAPASCHCSRTGCAHTLKAVLSNRPSNPGGSVSRGRLSIALDGGLCRRHCGPLSISSRYRPTKFSVSRNAWASSKNSSFWHRTDVSITPRDVSFEEKNRRTELRMIQTGS